MKGNHKCNIYEKQDTQDVKISKLCFEVFPSEGISWFLIIASYGMKNSSAWVSIYCTDHKRSCGCC